MKKKRASAVMPKRRIPPTVAAMLKYPAGAVAIPVEIPVDRMTRITAADPFLVLFGDCACRSTIPMSKRGHYENRR